MPTLVPEFDADLIRRYRRALPRYTSYPTAPHFSECVGEAEYVDEVDRTNSERDGGPISLYVHLPFCRSLCYYCGCHMIVTSREETVEGYLARLEREIDLLAARVHGDRKVVQLHWGGGTPSYLAPKQIERLGKHLRRRFRFADDAEVSLEADPRGLTIDHLEAARGVGFNRLSLGVQDLDPDVQVAIHRVQPESVVREALEGARSSGFSSVNLDLVYGLPHQSVTRFRRTLDAVLDMAPERIALFSYAHVPSIKKHQRLISEEALPAPEEKMRIFASAVETLTDPGAAGGSYRFIGLDHFARPDDELARAQDEGTLNRNFQGYSTRAGADVYAFGISGIHQLRRMYAQNVKGLAEYRERVDARRHTVYRGYLLSDDDEIRRQAIMELMCNLRLDKPVMEHRFGIDFDSYFSDTLERLSPLADDGLIDLLPSSLRVLPPGRFLLRNIAATFDAYLAGNVAGATSRPTYSQTV